MLFLALGDAKVADARYFAFWWNIGFRIDNCMCADRGVEFIHVFRQRCLCDIRYLEHDYRITFGNRYCTNCISVYFFEIYNSSIDYFK